MATRSTGTKLGATRVLEVVVKSNDGYGGRRERFRITIPASAKVTYSPANTMSKERTFDGMAMRIYEGTNQTALFRGVESFRDVSYPIVREVVEVEDDLTADSDSKGNVKVAKSRVVSSKWEDLL